jgi:D-arabinose 1-dehydrogenase-like Zn-dependent alcohol dehydrogenase
MVAAPKPIEEKPLKLAELPLPEPGPQEVRLRVLACAMCRTDLHTVEGEIPLPKLPITPGHQVVAVVDKLKKVSKKVTSSMLSDVATISANNDREIGQDNC